MILIIRIINYYSDVLITNELTLTNIYFLSYAHYGAKICGNAEELWTLKGRIDFSLRHLMI